MFNILKGVGKIDGDGWKDTTRKGEIVFAHGRELPLPYAPGQFERVGCIGWTASRDQYDFSPAGLFHVLWLLPAILADRKERNGRYSFRWEF